MMTRAKFRCGFNLIYLLGVVLAIASVAILSCVGILSDGLRHVETASTFRLAGEDLQNGNFSRAAHKFFVAIGMTIEGGVRSQIANAYFQQTFVLYRQGRLPEALNACAVAVRALGTYDDEGGAGYTCDVIQYQIQHSSLAPSHR